MLSGTIIGVQIVLLPSSRRVPRPLEDGGDYQWGYEASSHTSIVPTARSFTEEPWLLGYAIILPLGS